MLTGNRGEWSEIYALFKLLGDKELSLGDKDIEKLQGLAYPIIKILRTESNGHFEFSIEDEIVLISGGKELVKIPVVEFKKKSIFLLNAIIDKKGATFSIPEVEEFMQTINCISIKANSTTKTDITIVVHDQRTNQQPALGFSIKSQLGGPSTLLNAGKTTNFIYKIIDNNLTENEVLQINSMVIKRRNKESKDIRGRIQRIYSHKCNFAFSKTEKRIFSNNLILIDSRLPEILSHIIIEYYSSSNSKLTALVNSISSLNPLNFDITDGHKFYEYKIKRFLTDIALGMMPSKVWGGKYDATGGYLIVKEDGNVLCYHIYNKNRFEDYLLNNTKLETASSSRHGFGDIYEQDGELYFKLNLQIRFIR